jgi:hypothetical protein
MLFKCINNQTVELRILGYQFPEVTTPGDYDANWLRIYVKVQSQLGHWQTVDSSLTTWEFKKLISWFKDLSEDREVKYLDLTFMEPCLEFQLKKTTQSSKTIRIIFSAELRPKSAPPGKQYYVDCIFTNQDLSDVCMQLEKELEQTPDR